MRTQIKPKTGTGYTLVGKVCEGNMCATWEGQIDVFFLHYQLRDLLYHISGPHCRYRLETQLKNNCTLKK